MNKFKIAEMQYTNQRFLPTTTAEMRERGWEEADFILITGDAYVDHPSFGAAIISRLLESKGFRVAVLSQPDPASAKNFRILGRPRLGFLITAGNIDSMVNNYTVSKKRRPQDIYTAGSKPGLRPDRAAIVYSIRVREAFGQVPIILGGLEASLRRLAHYDYWNDKVRRSVLIDAGADIIVYGMGERAISEIAAHLAQGIPVGEIRSVRGTVYRTDTLPEESTYCILPSFKEVSTDKQAFARSFMLQYENNDHVRGKTLIESYDHCLVVQNPPALPLTREELDRVYELPFLKRYHPVYEADGGVPALEEIRFSLTGSRGCFGNCHFCSLTFHQGRLVSSRSHDSLVREATALTRLPGFKGYIHDVGGPTANFRDPACGTQREKGSCKNRDCLVPVPCKNLAVSHHDLLLLLDRLRKIPGVKKVFIRSGLRFDYIMADPDPRFLTCLVEHHVSGQLKVAPEHISGRVLALMNKAPHELFERFAARFEKLNRKLGKKQFLLPYYISGHPGSTLHDSIALACFFREKHFIPEQVQDFYPTPGTVSTCMYYTGINPRTGRSVYVARSAHEKAMQRALLHFHRSKNYRLVYAALMKAGRKDLIGYGPGCLIKPRHKRAGRTNAQV